MKNNSKVVISLLLVCATAMTNQEVMAQEVIGPDDIEIAKTNGITPQEAERRAKLSEKAAELAKSLEGNPAFLGLQINDNKGGYVVRVKFKGRPPSVSELTSDAELASVIQATASRKNLGEMRSLEKRVLAAAKARKIESMVFVDQDSEKIEVYVKDVEAFRAALRDLNIEADVTVKYTASFPQTVQATFPAKGGQQITAPKGNCTSGFGATRGTAKGFITAGHCVQVAMNGAAPTSGTATMNGASYSLGQAKWTSTTDFAFFSNANATASPTINAGAAERDLTSMASVLPANGSNLCKYGRTTGYNCAKVYNNSGSSTDASGNTVGPMVILNDPARTSANPLGAGGDSGGPVFYNWQGFGITSRADTNWLWFTIISKSSEISTTPATASPS